MEGSTKCLATARDVLRTQRETVWKNAPEELSCTDLVVFNSFLMHADAGGETFVRARTVARETRRSERSVRRSIARLRHVGLLVVVTERTTTGRANLYRLVLGGRAANDTSSGRRTGSREGLCEDRVQQPEAAEGDQPTTEHHDRDRAVSPVGEMASDNAPAAASPPPFGAPGCGQIGSTHAATVAAPPPRLLLVNRSQINDPPLSPPPGGERRGRDRQRIRARSRFLLEGPPLPLGEASAPAKPPRSRRSPQDEFATPAGRREALVFELLDEGLDLVEIVKRTRIDARTLRGIHEEWRALQALRAPTVLQLRVRSDVRRAELEHEWGASWTSRT
jgi:hypothetical protein